MSTSDESSYFGIASVAFGAVSGILLLMVLSIVAALTSLGATAATPGMSCLGWLVMAFTGTAAIGVAYGILGLWEEGKATAVVGVVISSVISGGMVVLILTALIREASR